MPFKTQQPEKVESVLYNTCSSVKQHSNYRYLTNMQIIYLVTTEAKYKVLENDVTSKHHTTVYQLVTHVTVGVSTLNNVFPSSVSVSCLHCKSVNSMCQLLFGAVNHVVYVLQPTH